MKVVKLNTPENRVPMNGPTTHTIQTIACRSVRELINVICMHLCANCFMFLPEADIVLQTIALIGKNVFSQQNILECYKWHFCDTYWQGRSGSVEEMDYRS